MYTHHNYINLFIFVIIMYLNMYDRSIFIVTCFFCIALSIFRQVRRSHCCSGGSQNHGGEAISQRTWGGRRSERLEGRSAGAPGAGEVDKWGFPTIGIPPDHLF